MPPEMHTPLRRTRYFFEKAPVRISAAIFAKAMPLGSAENPIMTAHGLHTQHRRRELHCHTLPHRISWKPTTFKSVLNQVKISNRNEDLPPLHNCLFWKRDDKHTGALACSWVL